MVQDFLTIGCIAIAVIITLYRIVNIFVRRNKTKEGLCSSSGCNCKSNDIGK